MAISWKMVEDMRLAVEALQSEVEYNSACTPCIDAKLQTLKNLVDAADAERRNRVYRRDSE